MQKADLNNDHGQHVKSQRCPLKGYEMESPTDSALRGSFQGSVSTQNPTKALLREAEKTRHWKEKAHKLADLLNRQLQRQASVLQSAAAWSDFPGEENAGPRPPSAGSSAGPCRQPLQPQHRELSRSSYYTAASSLSSEHLSWGELEALRQELEAARLGLLAQSAQLQAAREEYKARKACLQEAAGAARKEVLSLQRANRAMREQNSQLAAQLEMYSSAKVGRQLPLQAGLPLEKEQGSPLRSESVGSGQAGGPQDLHHQQQQAEEQAVDAARESQPQLSREVAGGPPAGSPQQPELEQQGSEVCSMLRSGSPTGSESEGWESDVLLRARVRSPGKLPEVVRLREDSRAKQQELMRALAEIQASRNRCEALLHQADNLAKQLELTTGALEAKDAELEAKEAELEAVKADLQEREGALGRLLAMCEAQAAQAEAAVQLDALRQQLAGREQTIQELQQALQAQASQVSALQVDMAASAAERQELQAQAEAALEGMRRRLRCAEEEQAALEADLGAMQERLRSAEGAQAELEARLGHTLQEAEDERAARLALAAQFEDALRERGAELEALASSGQEARAAVARLAAELAEAQAAQQAERVQREARTAELEASVESLQAQRLAALRRLGCLQHEMAEAELLLAPLCPPSRASSVASSPGRSHSAGSGAGNGAALQGHQEEGAGAEGCDEIDPSVAIAVTWLQQCDTEGPQPVGAGAATPPRHRPPRPSRLALRIRRLLQELQAAQRVTAVQRTKLAGSGLGESLQLRLQALSQEQGGDEPTAAARAAEQGVPAAAGLEAAAASGQEAGREELQGMLRRPVVQLPAAAGQDDSASELHSVSPLAPRSTASTPLPCSGLAPLGLAKTPGPRPSPVKAAALTPAGDASIKAGRPGSGPVVALQGRSSCDAPGKKGASAVRGGARAATESGKQGNAVPAHVRRQEAAERRKGGERKGGKGGPSGNGLLPVLVLAPLAGAAAIHLLQKIR